MENHAFPTQKGHTAATAATAAVADAADAVGALKSNRTNVRITNINTAPNKQNAMIMYGNICPIIYFKKGSRTST